MSTITLYLLGLLAILAVLLVLQLTWYHIEDRRALKRLNEWERKAGRPLMDRRNLPRGMR